MPELSEGVRLAMPYELAWCWSDVPDNVDETATMQQDAVRQSYPAFNIQQGRGEHLFNFEQ
jgi:hypothetical protein